MLRAAARRTSDVVIGFILWWLGPVVYGGASTVTRGGKDA